uniref:Ribosomal protein L22 n=3 Tax=Thermopsis TaxID=49852 RepID=A0A8F2WDU1_9FABA|nr:ribosomal protein L22 [Thermopsis alpina]QWW33953.1 ribosomal protein L22 [Thermopsis lanceolata]QWW34037.1 ribosomal protein L22 [Thermopsis turkestanica]
MLFYFFLLVYSATANVSHNMDFNELSENES